MAEEEFGRILKAARVKWERYAKAQGRDAELDKEFIIEAIIDGKVIVNDEGFPTVITESDNEKLKEIKIPRRPVRGDMLAADRVSSGHDLAKQDAVIGKLVGLAPALLQLLEEGDYRVLTTLWLIFLG